MDLFPASRSIENIEQASKFLHAILLAKSDELPNPSLDFCATALSVDAKLHEKLQTVHKERDLKTFEKFHVYFKRNAWRFSNRLSKLNDAIREIEAEGKIAEVARGKLNLKEPAYTPGRKNTDSKVTSHIHNLEIPVGDLQDEPLIILHKLGSFQHDSTLRKRLDNIFSTRNHTFLVNTSGTGKTRLLFEGLCLHWGFYFTFAVDTSFLAANDFPHAVKMMDCNRGWTNSLPPVTDTNHASLLQNNINVVHRALGVALLGRLLVFKMFLEACSTDSFCHDHRKRWLEMQILPTKAEDPFGILSYRIGEAYLVDSDIDEAIIRALEDIEDIWEVPPDEFFYVALDEANAGSNKYLHAFSDEYGPYPVLKEVLRSWRRRLGHLPIRFVVAGTMIPQEYFQSAVGEWDDFRWCSDTGSFNDPDCHRQYISQFLPLEFEESAVGQSLVNRMWQWLRGRHRYTASFLTVLLDSGFESPHSLLGDYVKKAAKYFPHDNHEYSRRETPRFNNWFSEIGSYGLSLESISTLEMHRAVVTFLTTSEGCVECVTTDRELITDGYGYFMDADCSQIALNEPLTVIYGAGWLKDINMNLKVTTYGVFRRIYGTEIFPSHFALFLALSFASFFDGFSDLSNAFSISGLAASSLEAKLVAFRVVEGRLKPLDIHLSESTPHQLVLLANTPVEAVSWFKHECNEPFCVLPSSSTNSVTLVFCLQLSNGQSFWVFVRVPSNFTNRGNPSFAQDIEDIVPATLFCDQPEIVATLTELPNPYPDFGPFGVLRVSGSLRVDKATENSIPREKFPAATLNIKELEEAAKTVSQDMLMRRLARTFAQGKMSPPIPVSSTKSEGDRPKHRRKRGRSKSSDLGDTTVRSKEGKVKDEGSGPSTAARSRSKRARGSPVGKSDRVLRSHRAPGVAQRIGSGAHQPSPSSSSSRKPKP